MGFNSGFKGLTKLAFSAQIFEKYWNIKFRGTPSSGRRVVPCGLTDMKRKVAFCSFANAPLISCLVRILGKNVACNYIVSFFFYWRYNPLWVLAFSVIFFHSAFSSHCFLHRLTPIICKSSSLPAIHLFRGLPLVLVPIGCHCNTLLGVLLSSIRITWPSQAILLTYLLTYSMEQSPSWEANQSSTFYKSYYYTVSLILHKYVERCVCWSIFGVACHVSDQGPAVWVVYKRRNEKFQHCHVTVPACDT